MPINSINTNISAQIALQFLNGTNRDMDQVQQRVSTGLKVNSALDDALAYFKARNLNSRAADLQNIKDSINGGVSIIKAAIQGLDAMESVIKQIGRAHV